MGVGERASPQAVLHVLRSEQWYKNPFIRYVMTLMEAFPVGLLITLISSLILKRKTPKGELAEAKA
jgi:hypothetical protein